MKKHLLLLLISLSISSSAMAQGYVITEWMSFVERTLQQVTEDISNIDFDDILGTKEEEQKSQDPSADGNPAVNENVSSVPVSEFPPYADASLRSELSKEKPSIPTVNTLIKDSLTFKSKTTEKEGDAYLKSGDFQVKEGVLGEKGTGDYKIKAETSVEPEKTENNKNTLEKQQAHSIVVYANARALARRTLDLINKVEDDTQVITNEKDQKSSTGSLYKTTSASLIFRTHMLLNEIATLRNSYIEILSIDTIQGEEAAPSATDQLTGMVKGVLGK